MDPEDVEDEVTFLLRLKPAPTPPIRKKIKSFESPSRKWDIMIEHHNSDVESTSSRHNSPVFGRRVAYGHNDDQSLSPLMNRRFGQNEVYANHAAPPLPPRWQPSAPPSEDETQHVSGFDPSSGNYRKCSSACVGQPEVNYFNLPPPLVNSWMGSGYAVFPQASPPMSLVQPNFIPHPPMEIQSPHRPHSSVYPNGNETPRNPFSKDGTRSSGKPPFSPTSQQKFVRPPKPTPRSSVPRDVRDEEGERSGRITVSFGLM